MRIVSLVPSWTETLLHCGVDVIGRTRFCIHPENLVKEIPIIGGTKDWNLEKIVELKPDLILLDQEENPKFMSEQTLFPWHATHVTGIADMPMTLETLSDVLKNESLKALGARWKSLQENRTPSDLFNLPGILEWGLKPDNPPKHILYMIWKNPWMCVSRDTFIGSVLNTLGIEIPKFAKKYPEVQLADYLPEETLLLFSSEPYPFFKKKTDLAQIGFPHAFVDGESFSWFGIRSLEFLEQSQA